jgi:dephospho-CoA kinase
VRRIAITGGVAEGKTTALNYLRDLGYSVESSDRIGREVFELPEVQRALAEILNLSMPINSDDVRTQLSNSELRRRVNELMHPRILARLSVADCDFVEVPLLIETCLQSYYDCVWVVTCGPDEQLKRLTERLGSEGDALALIRTQLTSGAKITFADTIIRTNLDELSVKRCVTLAARRDLR